MNIEERLARLETLEEIRRLVSRFQRATDQRNDPAIISQIFTPDCTWASQGRSQLFGAEVRYSGLDSVVSGLSATAQNTVLQSWHHFGPPEIDLNGNLKSANVRTYLFEIMKRADVVASGEGPATMIMGAWYDMTVVDAGEGWKIRELTLHMKFAGRASPDLIYP